MPDSKRLSLALLSCLLLAACRSEQIDRSGIVDPVEHVHFAEEIQPLLARSCGGSSCHIGGAMSGVSLSSHQSIRSSVGLQYGGLIVVPGDADASPLVDKIEPQPEHGARMPMGRAPLSSAEIALVRQWIDLGAGSD